MKSPPSKKEVLPNVVVWLMLIAADGYDLRALKEGTSCTDPPDSTSHSAMIRFLEISVVLSWPGELYSAPWIWNRVLLPALV